MTFYNEEYIDDGKNRIHRTAIIGSNVELGQGNVIYPYAVIGQPGAIRGANKNTSKVIIGDNNKIMSHVCIMSGEEGDTKIGDDNLIMNFVNIGHNVEIGNCNEIGAHSVIAGYVKIMNHVKIKIGALIRNRKHVSSETVVGMGAVVVDDVTQGTVKGNPAK